MPRITPEQVETLHQLINEACNAATDIAERLPSYGSVDPDDLEADMLVRVRSTRALLIRDALVELLDSLNDDPS